MPVVVPFSAPIDVTDHAVVRWLERVCGVDIEKYRAEIRAAFLASGITHLGDLPDEAAAYVDVPGCAVHLVVRCGCVTTVFHAGQEPD
jgi:hypothetical protein